MRHAACRLRELRGNLAATGTPDDDRLSPLTGHDLTRDGFTDSHTAARGAGELRRVAFALVAPDSDAAGVACRHAF